MKRLLAVLLILVLTLAACTTAPPAESSDTQESVSEIEEKPSTDGVKITLFQSKVEITDQLEKVAADYTTATGVEVEVWGSAGDDYRNQLQAHMAGGEGPVMFTVGGMAEYEQFSKYILDLSAQDYVKNISPGLALESDGKVFGVPNGIEGFGLVINESLVKADEIKDMAGFIKMFDTISADKKSPLLLSQEDYFLIAHILNTPFAMQADYVDFVAKLNAGEVKMAETEEFKELAKVMELIREKSTNPMEVTYDKQIAAFADGEAAAIHQGNWAFGMFEDYDVTFDMTMAPLPILGNDKISIGVGGYWCINSDASEEQIAAANDFYNFLLGSKEGYDILINDFGFIPPFTDAEYTSDNPLSQVVFEYANSGNSLPWTFPIWPQGIIEASLAPATQGFFADPAMSGEQLLQSLDEAWQLAQK